MHQVNFTGLLQRFLYYQQNPGSEIDWDDVPLHQRPSYHGKISLYASAVATFYAPSDICGVGGMRQERIRAVPVWRKEGARYDCVFVTTDPSVPGFRGRDVARVRQFFSFSSGGACYPCALVHWFCRTAETPDEETGMWVVEREVNADRSPFLDIIHLDTIVRAAHLLPVCGDDFVPQDLVFDQTLNAFHSFYVNKFIDHHAFEIAS